MGVLDNVLSVFRPAPQASFIADAATGWGRSTKALTAAAVQVTPLEGVRLAKSRRPWQTAAMGYRKAVPEVGYVNRFLGNNCNHIRLFVGDRRPGADEVVELDNDYDLTAPGALPADIVEAAQAALHQLTGNAPSGGGASILSPLVQNLEGPGECWLVGRYFPEQDRSTWAIHSISEVKFIDGRLPSMDPLGPRGYYRLVTGEGKRAEAVDLDPAATTVVRLWTADPEYSSEPDSPMRTLGGVCERLLLIDKANDAALRSRAAGNGFLLMPEEIDPPSDDEDPDDEADEFQREFTTQLTTPLIQDGSAAQAVPGIIRGPAAYLAAIRHLTLERPIDPKLAELETRSLARLGIGLDVPPEVITGYADVNHWNVWQISADTFKHHQEPITITGCELLTLGYIRAFLLTAGFPRDEVERIVIWYDPSSLIAQPDRSEVANQAHDRKAISDKAYRRMIGVDESDAPEEVENPADQPVGQTGMLVSQLAAVAQVALTMLNAGYVPEAVNTALGLNIEHSGVVPTRQPQALPGGQNGVLEVASVRQPLALTAAAAAAPAPTDEQRRLSRRLMEIDRRLRERIIAAADAALARALERAGNRVRSTAQKDETARVACAGIPGERIPATLGRALVASLGNDESALLAEAFAKLRGQYLDWTSTAAEEAIDTAAALTGLDRGSDEVKRLIANLRDQFAEAAETSWPILEDALNDRAVNLMYDPDPSTPDVGEVPDALVEPGIVRAALAIAGGIASDATGRPPLSGLTSGQLLQAFLRSGGVEPVEHEWSYGISARTFPPHRNLDGLIFADFDDPELSTSGTGHEWVGDSFIPGDHRGCHCDYALIYADGNTRDELELLGRTAYREQKGKDAPTAEADLLGIRTEPIGRPETRRTARATR